MRYISREKLWGSPPPKPQNFGKNRVKIEKRWRKEEKVGKNEEKTGKGIFPSIFKNFTGRGRRPPPQNGGGGDKGPLATPLWSAFALGRNIFVRIWLLLI